MKIGKCETHTVDVSSSSIPNSKRKWGISHPKFLLLSANAIMYAITTINAVNTKPILEHYLDAPANHPDTSFEYASFAGNASAIISDRIGWIRPPVIYGHIHMAKTAGTEINGLLANQFERVCGHKGFSYDAFQNQERVKRFMQEHPDEYIIKAHLDSISKAQPKHNRGRVNRIIMDEIGYEDCDYISMEHKAEFWSSVSSRWEMELHVPCREPLEHLMSMCNYKKKVFECDEGADDGGLESEINKCILDMERFKESLKNDPNITLKCFNPLPVSSYVSYMGKILQRKRVESEYIHRDTNTARKKEEECIWKMSGAFQNRVLSILKTKYPFFGFCAECMNSTNELKLE